MFICRPGRLLVVSILLAAQPALACTTFCLRHDDRIVFGKNYDWAVPDGMLVVNKRGVERVAENDRDGEPMRWVSRYGSVTFNQYGRDFPSGGMNETGLVVELMWLDAGQYPAPDARRVVGNLQWIQYQLDTATTVEEVIVSDQVVRIAARSPLHYLVADRSGAVAAVEFLDGELVVHTGEDLPVAALTNDTYDRSLRHYERIGGDGHAGDHASLARFAHAAQRAGAFASSSEAQGVAYAFETLEQVAQGDYTQWSIVYEIDRGRLHVRTREQPEVKSLTLADLDFACATPVQVLDLGADLAGDVATGLRRYTMAANLALVRASFGKTAFLADTAEAALVAQGRYPDVATRCRVATGG